MMKINEDDDDDDDDEMMTLNVRVENVQGRDVRNPDPAGGTAGAEALLSSPANYTDCLRHGTVHSLIRN